MIPKNIYRAWQTQTFHKKVEKRIKKTIRINKEYSHVIFTEPQRDDFVYANFEGSITEAYQQLNNVVAKVDLWRYLIIYKHGGVYLDMDASIERPISTFISDDDQAVISAETNENLFLQWALFYKKEHPIIKFRLSKAEMLICLFDSQNIDSQKFCDIINRISQDTFDYKAEFINYISLLLPSLHISLYPEDYANILAFLRNRNLDHDSNLSNKLTEQVLISELGVKFMKEYLFYTNEKNYINNLDFLKKKEYLEKRYNLKLTNLKF